MDLALELCIENQEGWQVAFISKVSAFNDLIGPVLVLASAKSSPSPKMLPRKNI